MKDLKHLYYFENLLDDVNNELIRQAKNEGKLAIGYTCLLMSRLFCTIVPIFLCTIVLVFFVRNLRES